MVEIWLVYFACAKADYVFEIPVVSGIPVQDVTTDYKQCMFLVCSTDVLWDNANYAWENLNEPQPSVGCGGLQRVPTRGQSYPLATPHHEIFEATVTLA